MSKWINVDNHTLNISDASIDLLHEKYRVRDGDIVVWLLLYDKIGKICESVHAAQPSTQEEFLTAVDASLKLHGVLSFLERE